MTVNKQHYKYPYLSYINLPFALSVLSSRVIPDHRNNFIFKNEVFHFHAELLTQTVTSLVKIPFDAGSSSIFMPRYVKLQ